MTAQGPPALAGRNGSESPEVVWSHAASRAMASAVLTGHRPYAGGMTEIDAARCPECHMPLTEHHDPGCSKPCGRCEEVERQRWVSDVKARLGLVCAGDLLYLDTVARDYVRWPPGLPLGQYTVISDHRLEVPPGWPPECLCVLIDSAQVSLGGPCPVHSG